MIRSTVVGVVVAFVAATSALPGEFPFEFKTLPAAEVMAFPGGYGVHGSLMLSPPEGIRGSPRAKSSHPLFGRLEWGEGEGGMHFRLDESAGDGKGYDRLIVDLNRNGDLTDDAVVARATGPGAVKSMPGGREQVLFGPLEVPAPQRINQWPLVYFAEMYIYNPDAINRAGVREQQVGIMRFKAGWFLEAGVEVDGRRYQVGLVDGNANLRLGDAWKPTFYGSDADKFWYFRPGDSYLFDADNSGTFEGNPFGTEQVALGPVLYFGSSLYRSTVAADFKSVRVEPWTEPLGEVSLQPEGGSARVVTLAWQRAENEWQVIDSGCADGKVKVPSGNYRLISTVLSGKSPAGQTVTVGGYYRKLDRTLTVAAGGSAELRMGAPLEARITTEMGLLQGGEKGFFTRLRRMVGSSGSDQMPALRISAAVVGAAAETYASFAKGDDLTADPPKPRFAIKDAAGKVIATGDMEYG